MSEPTSNPHFRPNSERSIHINGAIDRELLNELSPKIVAMTLQSREPITVFIDSPGGSVFYADQIFRLLTLPTQDFGAPCRLIVVGLSLVASAASDLLVAGDYALVYPYSTIMCHGVRQSGVDNALTRERAIDLAKSLASTNEQYALQLAHNSIARFMFRYAFLRPEFEGIRASQEGNPLSDASCILLALKERVSPQLWGLLTEAMIRSLDNDILDTRASKMIADHGSVHELPTASFEALLLKCIVDHLVDNHKDEVGWSLRKAGFNKIEENFEILVDSHAQRHKEQIQKLTNRWGEFFLEAAERTEFSAVAEDNKMAWLLERVAHKIRSVWFLFVSICRLLQESDHFFNADDAYWVGLIDEIIGRNDLPSPRTFVEFAPSE
jgi:ATP-dependent protease ClpP protease subunit